MRIDILTLFSQMFAGPFDESIIKRAVERDHVHIHLHDIRDWATDRHRTVDDYPYGGGAGMVLKVEPLGTAIEEVRALGRPAPVILMTPQGRPLSQNLLEQWAQSPRLILVCGHYEGVDERTRILHVDEEISIGDYVLTGGELPAMVLVDALVRLLPGVLDEASLDQESHDEGLLEHPHYTRPAHYRGLDIPAVLLSGHHAEIARWRRQEALRRTLERRPELLAQASLYPEDRAFLRELGWPATDTQAVNRGGTMRTRLLLATNNRGKAREYQKILEGLPVELVTPADLSLELEVEETGQSFAENAILKAEAFAQTSGLLTLADDSGLEVDALDGAPGVRSARYGGEQGNDVDRYRLLLDHLRDVPPEQRGARFRCVIAIATPTGEIHTCEGICPGVITDAPQGAGGFGYDPVFFLPELGRTMAELAEEEKNRFSHRGRAGQLARALLLELLRV